MPEEPVFPPAPATEVNEGIISQTDSETDQEEQLSESEPEQSVPLELDIDDLKMSRKRAFLEFRCRVEDAILGGYILGKSKSKFDKTPENLREITLWGVPLLPSKGHESTDTILMKFLKAKDYRASDAFSMLRKTLKWRRDFNVSALLDEKFNPELENLWYVNGKDKEGRPLCYNVFGNFKNKDLENDIWGSHDHRQECIRWRVQTLEKGIQQLDFKPGGVNSIIQITDLRNCPGSALKEVRWISRKMINLLQDHYPGVIYKNIIINVPLWFSTLHALNLRMITQRSKNKFIFVKPSRVTKTLLRYITPENLLVQYGGLKQENDPEFSIDDKVLEISLRASTIGRIQIPVTEVEVTITWDLIMVGNEVTYKEEFIPDDDCSYRVLLQQEKKMGESVRNSFHIREPGKIVITVENPTYKKKKVFYRYRTKPSVPMYMILH